MAQIRGWNATDTKQRFWLERILLRRGTGEMADELGYG